MEIKEVKHMMKLQRWAAMVQLCQGSGQPVRKWCEENGVYIKTYYYRLKRVRQEALEIPVTDMVVLPSQTQGRLAFAEVTLPDNSQLREGPKDAGATAVTIMAGPMSISIHNGAEPGVIASVIKAAGEIIEGGYFQ